MKNECQKLILGKQLFIPYLLYFNLNKIFKIWINVNFFYTHIYMHVNLVK